MTLHCSRGEDIIKVRLELFDNLPTFLLPVFPSFYIFLIDRSRRTPWKTNHFMGIAYICYVSFEVFLTWLFKNFLIQQEICIWYLFLNLFLWGHLAITRWSAVVSPSPPGGTVGCNMAHKTNWQPSFLLSTTYISLHPFSTSLSGLHVKGYCLSRHREIKG